MSARARLTALGLTLPVPPKAVANFVPATRHGNLLYLSGHGPLRPDGSSVTGVVGDALDVPQAREAAQLVGLGMLATIEAALGNLERVQQVVKVLGMVRATPDFAAHPQVIDGFSDLWAEVFGPQRGRGARSAIGVASLPFGIAVEIEAIVAVTAT